MYGDAFLLNHEINRREKDIEKEIKTKQIEQEKYSLNIYLLGDSIKETKDFITTIKIDNKIEKSKISNYWQFFSFIGDINVQKEESFKKFDQQINDVKNGKIKFKEVFIIQVKELSETIIKSFLKKFNDMEEYYQPFIIFIPLSKNKTENEQNINKITKEFNKIDKRNIFCEQNLDNVKKKVAQFCAYYNELGDIFYDHENFFAYINIFFIGDTGSGKSTFIDLLLNEKRAKIGGNGIHSTNYINYYQIQNYPIKLYDFPGIEKEEIKEETLKKIGNLKDDFKSNNEKVHFILFFIDGQSQTLFKQLHFDVIKKILDKDTKVLFIETHSYYDKDEKDDYEDYFKKSYKIRDCISQIIKDDNKMNKFLPILENKEIGNFFSVNLKEEKIKKTIIPVFGIKNLMTKISNDLISEKKTLIKLKDNLEKREIDDPFNDTEIMKIIEENYFLKNFRNFDKLVEAKEKEANELISKKIWFSVVLGIIPIVDIIGQNLLNKNIKENLEKIYGFKVDNNIENDEIPLDEDERKEFEEEENDNNSNIKGSLLKLSRIGSVGGNIWNIFYSAVVSVSKAALGIVFAAIGIIIGVGSSMYMTYKDGKELIPIFTKHFRKKKALALLNYVNAFLNGINYFENLGF